MSQSFFIKISCLFAALFGFVFSSTSLQAQHLFAVNQNNLSQENRIQLLNQISNCEISTLQMVKNNENKNVFPVVFSSTQNTQIIILNELTGNSVVITPVNEAITEFQLTPFFIEELKQATLGEADRYLVVETTSDFSVKKVFSVYVSSDEPYIPRYFYGKKENVKEALPKDRQIIHIFKEKPQIISAFPNDPAQQSYIAQIEEEMSYYVYMYKLPDGTLCIYDEHFNPDNTKSSGSVGNYLEFELTGTLNDLQRSATEFGLELWSNELAGTVPVSINVDFYPLGAGIIGMSFRTQNFLDTETNTWYCSALWNQLVGYNATSMNDISILMSSNFNFYFGYDGVTSKIDYVTIVIHEVTHGLGFYSMCDNYGTYSYTTEEGYWENTDFPGIYDRMLYKGISGPCLTELNQNERAELMTSNNMYAAGPNLLVANEGDRVKIFAPSTYMSGSSSHHWDNSVTFPTFMKFAYDYPLHTFNNRKIGIFMDLGWKIPDINPEAIWVYFFANGGEGYRPPQTFMPGIAQKLKINPFTNAGYSFSNWNTSSDGTGDSFYDRETITIYEDMNLFVKWKPNEYTLKFYADMGIVSPKSKQVTYGEPIGELPIPEKEGYTFKEWKIGPVVIDERTTWKYISDMTAMATWGKIQRVFENQNFVSVQVTPNPTNNYIEVSILNEELKINIVEFYNIVGQLVKTAPIKEKLSRIDISDLKAGVYMVKVDKKIVKLVVN
ncbi:MAG: InlB B-repeat-containing protein [Bacteroidales bacterium]|jgi:hypothetical protein|nr:InlB B-repeat-containing protein [Bacteroidales bacterium]